MKKIFLLFFVAMLSNTSAVAGNWYIDGGLGFISFDDGSDTISPTNIYFRGGYMINQNFSIGIESSVTISPDQVAGAPGVDFDVNVGTFFIRAGAPVSDNVMVYGQIGSSNTELTGSFGPASVSVDDTDTMIGFGANIGIGAETTYIAINYSIYNDNDGVDASALNLGIGTRF